MAKENIIKVKVVYRKVVYGTGNQWEVEGIVKKVTPTGRHTVVYMPPHASTEATRVFDAKGAVYPYDGIGRLRMIKDDK